MGDDTSSRPNKKAYQKVLQEDLPQEGSLLHKWEQINRKRCGVSKAASWIVLAAAALLTLVLLILLGRWMFSAPPSPAPVGQEKASSIDLDPFHQSSLGGDGFSKTTTVISTHIGPDGKMVTETTTEKFGTDADGHTTATRETKKGQGADGEAEKMMAEMNNLMGGFNIGNLLGDLFGGQQQQQDPFQQLFGHHHGHQHQGFFGQRQDPFEALLGGGNRGPFDQLFGGGGPHIQMRIGQPAQNVLQIRDMFQPQRQNPFENIFSGILGGVLDELAGPGGPEIHVVGQPEFQVTTINLSDILGGKDHPNSGTAEIHVIGNDSKDPASTRPQIPTEGSSRD